MAFCILCGETDRPGDLAAHKIRVHGERPPEGKKKKQVRKLDLAAVEPTLTSAPPKLVTLQHIVPAPPVAPSTGFPHKSRPKPMPIVSHRHRLIGAAGNCANPELRCVICDLQGPLLMALLAAGWLPLCAECLPLAQARQVGYLAAMAKGKKKANAAKREAFLMKQLTLSGGGANGTGKRR